eukprot:comp21342_c0_seq1/m.29273 comp21342_c0_seq1/g.29273  ORF comp21342_c0_seq1/g.29273 comp21342_c0_seq1/m.29273 type:complete len:582 (-) comp21342_c0_seq1:108-1853(-)
MAGTPDKLGASPKDNIKVVIRVRPLEASERMRGQISVWHTTEHTISQVDVREEKDKNRRLAQYAFDNIFDCVPTENIYDAVGEELVFAAMDGFNATIFAYGQTNSGKTYTMRGFPDDPGVIPLALQDVFSYIAENPSREYLLRVSYMEIYNEVVNDLLAPENTNLKIHEDKLRGVYVQGLKEQVVMSLEQVMTLLASGEAHRKVGRTNYNAVSSRSHTILSMTIESREKGHHHQPASATPTRGANMRMTPTRSSPARPGGGVPVRVSNLNLIDLAGSEKLVDDEERRKEGGYINRSLLTLGNVISKLSEGNRSHIPYRDSKLTRILQNSLTGNARIAVVCTVNPAPANFEESNKTLLFAQRAKLIQTSAHMNELVDDKTMLRKYRDEIAELQRQLEEYVRTGGSGEEKQLVEQLMLEKEQIIEELKEKDMLIPVLKERIAQLTKQILNSTVATPPPQPAVPRDNMATMHIRQARHQLATKRSTGVESFLEHDPVAKAVDERDAVIAKLQQDVQQLKATTSEMEHLKSQLEEREFEIAELTATMEGLVRDNQDLSRQLALCVSLLRQHGIEVGLPAVDSETF